MVLFFYLGAVLSAPYPGVTSYEGTSESSKERPEESVSDDVFCFLVSNMENRGSERLKFHCQTTQDFMWFPSWKYCGS